VKVQRLIAVGNEELSGQVLKCTYRGLHASLVQQQQAVLVACCLRCIVGL